MVKQGVTMQNVKGIVKLFEFGLKEKNYNFGGHSDYVAFTTHTGYSILGNDDVMPYGCNVNHYALYVAKDSDEPVVLFKCQQKTNTSDDVFVIISDDFSMVTVYANQRISDSFIRTTIDCADMPSNIKIAQLESDTYTFEDNKMILPTYGFTEEEISVLKNTDNSLGQRIGVAETDITNLKTEVQKLSDSSITSDEVQSMIDDSLGVIENGTY